jgi:hypothetical protein
VSVASTDDWQRREELLDELLALPAAARAARLAAIERQSAQDAAALRGWLSGIDRSADYLAARKMPAPGMLVGAWRLERPLGRGGMGEVWLGARADGLFEKQVAIKFISDGRASLRRSFESERRVLAGLQHSGIVRLLDAGLGGDDHPYLVTDYIDGDRLDAWLAREPRPLARRIALLRQVAAAVAYAHERLVIHRDIKPANLLVDGSGDVHLLDFGIARALAGDGESPAATLIALTPDYAAPELAVENAASVRSDIYALGGLLYFLLCGRPPLALGSLALAALVDAIRTQEPARIDADADAMLAAEPRHRVADLEAIARKALSKDPQRRYGSVEALMRDVDAALADLPIAAREADAWDRTRRTLRRHRVALAATATLLLTLAAGLAGTLWQAHEARLQRDRAERETVRATAEAKGAVAVRDFLVGVFEAANPEQTGGNVPTALDLLDAGLRRVDGELQQQPRLQVPLLAALGATYEGLGQADRAIDTLRRARTLAVTLAGEDSVDAMRTTVQLAAAIAAHPNADSRRQRDDIAPHLEAMIGREMSGPDVPLRVAALTQYGVLLEARGEGDASEANLRRAVDIGRAAGSEAAAETADALSSLHAVLVQRGRVRDAIALLREALAIRVLRDGEHAASVVAIQANLGFLLGEAGSLDEAAQVLAQVLETRRGIYGEGHPMYAHSLIALASIRERQGRYAEAEAMLRDALSIARSVLGNDSDLALSALNSLAGVRSGQHDPGAAIDHSREAVAMATRLHGRDGNVTLNIRDNLVGLQAMNGSYAEAAAAARESIAAHASVDSRNTAYARFWLGYALRLQGDAAAAKTAHEEALAGLLALQGEDSNFAITVRTALAEDERDLEAYDAARAHAGQARDAAMRVAPDADDASARAVRYLIAQLDVLQARSTAATAAELDAAWARAKHRQDTPMVRWQAAEAALFAVLCRQQLGADVEAKSRAQLADAANVLRASPLADPFLKRLATRVLSGAAIRTKP